MALFQRLWSSREVRRLAVFLVILGAIAAYLNWQWADFARQSQQEAVARKTRPSEGATLVAAPGPSVAAPVRHDFYAETRLERDRTRSEQVQLLREIVGDAKSTAEARSDAQRRLLDLSRRVAQETEAESLIRAKGFPDAVVFLQESGAVVVVKDADLRPAEAARIADVTAAATGIAFSEVRIIPYAR